jgi:hypothetical protein
MPAEALRPVGAGVEVADDRARDHAHCRTDPLQEAKRDQPADGRRKRATDRS